MPYIDQDRKHQIEEHGGQPVSPGELNYCITKMLINYAERRGLSYQTINDIIGALEGAKMEFYRRVAAPYEAGKIKENGEIYPLAWTGYPVNWYRS